MQDIDHDAMIALLHGAREGILAMLAEGRPYCLPFGYVFVDGSVCISLFPLGRKWRCLQNDPRVCFTVFGWNDEHTRWSSVVIEGEMAMVSDLAHIRRVVTANMRKIGLDETSGYLEKRMSYYEQALSMPDALRIMEIQAARMSGRTMAAQTGE